MGASPAGADLAAGWFGQAWARALAQVSAALNLGAGAAPEVEAVEPAEADGPVERVAQAWDLAGGARLSVAYAANAPAIFWLAIGGDIGDAGEAPDTFLEALNQTAGEAAAAASERLGRPVRAEPFEPAAEAAGGYSFQLRARAGEASWSLWVDVNEALAAALDAPPPAAPPQAATPAPPGPAERPAGEPSESALQLLRDVDLELAVSFGGATMPLAEVLKLASGSIVELNRAVTDPVDVLVNNSLIARGEVVVVDGNYGVRVTEIVSRGERARSVL